MKKRKFKTKNEAVLFLKKIFGTNWEVLPFDDNNVFTSKDYVDIGFFDEETTITAKICDDHIDVSAEDGRIVCLEYPKSYTISEVLKDDAFLYLYDEDIKRSTADIEKETHNNIVAIASLLGRYAIDYYNGDDGALIKILAVWEKLNDLTLYEERLNDEERKIYSDAQACGDQT